MTDMATDLADDGACGSDWTRTFEAVPSRVRDARRFLGAVLNGSPSTDDALTCVSELAANAVLHSDSRKPGGTFTVRVCLGGARLRVEVEDAGGPWLPRTEAGCEYGRGLAIVRELAGGYTVCGSEGGRSVAFEMDLR